MNTLHPDDSGFSEERLRAGIYVLLAGLLAAPPDAAVLGRLGAIEAEQELCNRDAMARAWLDLKHAAQQVQGTAVNEEYQQLFIGLGRGEVMPYGSWYLTGFLLERPLGDLREDLAALGYERQEHVREPEDHAAFLCEVMALLIMDEAITWEVQQKFFETHVGSWMEKFFGDLEEAASARFYRAVGRLGGEFIKLERHYLTMPV